MKPVHRVIDGALSSSLLTSKGRRNTRIKNGYLTTLLQDIAWLTCQCTLNPSEWFTSLILAGICVQPPSI